MKSPSLYCYALALTGLSVPLISTAQSADARLDRLEHRLDALEDRQLEASRPTALNPRISVVLNGLYYDDSAGGEGTALLGEAAGFHTHPHDHADGHSHDLERGFSLAETEIGFSATVDPYFDAALFLALGPDGDAEIEEAYAATRALPAGLKVKFGKFLSGIGYQNEKHRHEWAFADQNLVYSAFLGEHGLVDTGVQLTWLPAWDYYARFGIESLQGEQERFGAHLDDPDLSLGSKRGPRLTTVFFEASPDLGYDHTLLAGLFAAYARQHQEAHAHDGEEAALDGDAWLVGTEWVYGYDSTRAYGAGDLKLQAEYLYRAKDLRVAANTVDPAEVGEREEARQDGLYLQGVYGIAPRWSVAARYAELGVTRNDIGHEALDPSRRVSLAVGFHPTEFSLLRLQYSRSDAATEEGSPAFDQWYLQYVHSFGSHPSHNF